LGEIDIPISNIAFKDVSSSNNFSEPKPDILTLSSIIEDAKILLKSGTKLKTTLTHTTSLGDAEFDLDEESRGTKNLMGFFGPWAAISQNGIAIIDEFDSSLHPNIVEALIKKHLASTNTGQLIFTTHDTHLMDAKLLRRDQFWLTERDANGATQLRSIHDFDGREGEDIEKRYYEGRYRALPILRKN
jgi:AAA15 family ATPase/GTPase